MHLGVGHGHRRGIEEEEEHISNVVIRVGDTIMRYRTVEYEHITSFHPFAYEFVTSEDLQCLGRWMLLAISEAVSHRLER